MNQLPARDHIESERALLKRIRNAMYPDRARLSDNSSSESRFSDGQTRRTELQSATEGLSVDESAGDACDVSSNVRQFYVFVCLFVCLFFLLVCVIYIFIYNVLFYLICSGF